MSITRDNYELWFLDYLDGNLDERKVDDFLEFLRENPDLSEELQLFEAIGLTESNLVFSDKKKLYKESFDLPDIFDSAAIGLFEGDLDQDEQVSFNNYLKHHPEKNRELQLFKLSKLTPDVSLFFKNKKLLYRHSVVRMTTRGLLRIAAVFVFIFAFSRVLEKPFEEMITGNSLIIFTSENPAALRPDLFEQSISAPATEKPLPGSDVPGNIPEERNPKEKNPGSPALSELDLLPESVREYQPPLLSFAYSSPVNEIQTTEPELMAIVLNYEIAAVDEPANVSLSHKFFQKIGLSGLNPGKVVRWGLSLATNLTKEKFNYATDASGEIIALNLDTRLVGLSIPVNRK